MHRCLLFFSCGLISWTLLTSAGIRAADCTDVDPWLAGGSYSRGDLVVHGESLWRAKRNTTGVTPGTHKPTWANLGPCDSSGGGNGEEPVVTPIQVFGVWHAGNHYADWSLVRDMAEFDEANAWIINGNSGSPSVNLVVLSFLQPLQVLNMDPADPTTGVPVGMTRDIVDYFADAGISVMMSIGGITYTDFWTQALGQDATKLGTNAALIADYFRVGIEIDYEENSDPDLEGLEAFIDAYRDKFEYAPAKYDQERPGQLDMRHRLTVDLAAGGRYLQKLNRHATMYWLQNGNAVLDWANAMVHRSSGTPSHWQEHVDGMPTYDPVIPPKAPNRFTGGLFLKGNMANCTNFDSSEQKEHIEYVTTVLPNGAGTTPGMLGYMFWAAEIPSARKNYTPTTPEGNTCEGGMGVAAREFDIPVPMQPLRQDWP